MSILSDAAGAPAQQGAERVFFIIVLSMVAVAVGLAWRIGVFRRRSIEGPSRLGDGERASFLLLVIGGALLTFILAQLFCVAVMIGGADKRNTTTAATNPTTTPTSLTMNELTPKQMAVSTSVPFVVAFAFMIVANSLFRVDGILRLGLSRSQLLPGILMGLVGSAIAVPLTFLASWATELVWQLLHFVHPTEHELLRVLGEQTSPLVSILLVISATVIAPLAEETLMRGHLQTLLTHGLSRLGQRRNHQPMARGFEIILPGGEAGYVSLPPAIAPYHPPSIMIRWISVSITSLLFARMHDFWMMPPIFVLAVCLGYAYERTGNLWTAITMHAMFNTTSTVLFLYVIH